LVTVQSENTKVEKVGIADEKKKEEEEKKKK
jgi:hypothetical protein